MSASDIAKAPPDQSFFCSLCATLEGKLASKICSSLQTVVARTACATLKEGIHDVLNAKVKPNEPQHTDTLTRETDCLREVCPSLEDVVANAVCAALKQAMSDTVCATLKKAIHNTMRDLLEAEKGAPLRVSAIEFCFSLEDVVANAVCAALKQAVADTLCEPLKKAATHAVHDAFEQAQSDGRYDRLADVNPPYLAADQSERPLKREDRIRAIEACDRVVETLAKEMCARLQQLVVDTLCPLLRKRVKHTIKRHAHGMQSEHVSEQSLRTYKRLDVITSTHTIAFFVVTGLVIVGFFSTLLISGLLSPSSPVSTLFPHAASTNASVANAPIVPTYAPHPSEQASIPPNSPSKLPNVSPNVSPSEGPNVLPTPPSVSPSPSPLTRLETPLLSSPQDNANFSHVPRTVTLQWQTVPGATGYRVEVEYYDYSHPASDNSAWPLVGYLNPPPTTSDTSYTFNFIGAQPGRWRVTALDSAHPSLDSLPSNWRYFEFSM